MVKSYCLKERKLTKNVNPKIAKTKNNRLMEVSKCASSGAKRLGSLKMIELIQHLIYDYLLY